MPLLRHIAQHLLDCLLRISAYELSITLVGDRAMTRLNEKHLGHQGTTDVITFDYHDPADPSRICGDIFISLEEAITQGARFHTTWASEVVRYTVHAILHLTGHDDATPDLRRSMKRAENHLLKALGRQFRIAALAQPTRSGRGFRRSGRT